MNYIKQIQAASSAQQFAIEQAQKEIDCFILHLQSPKFTGTEQDDSRKDWIATGDVIRRMQELRQTLLI